MKFLFASIAGWCSVVVALGVPWCIGPAVVAALACIDAIVNPSSRP